MGFNGKPAQTKGFTLVELLLAITLMSILLGLTYSGLRAATRSTQSGEIILAANGKMRAAHRFVHRQLNQMLPLAFAVKDDVRGTRIVFTGDSRSIQYIAPMPGYLGSGGPQVQLLEFADSADGGVLQISHALLQTFDQGSLYDQDPVILLEGIESAGFEFLGRNEEGALEDWTSNWDQQDALPVAVRLSIEFSEDVQIEWPVLIAGIRLDDSFFKDEAAELSTYQLKMRELINNKGDSE